MSSQPVPDGSRCQVPRQDLKVDDHAGGTNTSQQGNEGQTPRLHILTLRSQYLHAIKSGWKTVEGRTYFGKYRDICVGDMIQFVGDTNPDEEVVARVTHVNVYPGFKEMLVTEGISACLPGLCDIDEGVQIYHSFPMYEERSREYGALALRIEKMS